jgi:hypothetical protein
LTIKKHILSTKLSPKKSSDSSRKGNCQSGIFLRGYFPYEREGGFLRERIAHRNIFMGWEGILKYL